MRNSQHHLASLKQLLHMLDDSIERPSVNCCIKCFAKIKSAELAAFIYAHVPEVKLKNQFPKDICKLDDVIAAIESVVSLENNQIYYVYQCQDKPKILSLKHKKA